jgi:hypothetical protein
VYKERIGKVDRNRRPMDGKETAMEREGVMGAAGGEEFEDGAVGDGPASGDTTARPGPTWRGLVLAVVAAVILSVAATLLLGGSFSFRKAAALPAGVCGAGGACCPPAETAAGR